MPLFNPPQLRWNDTDGTYEFVLKGGNVTLPIGQGSNQRVLNPNLGYTLLNGRVVKVIGAQGNRTAVDYAIADSDTNSMTVLGVATEDIANNLQGFITTEGLVRDIDTSAFPEGSVLWLSPSTPGIITHVKPAAPDHLVMVGYCIRSHAVNGSILVKVQNGYELDELHNVLITAAANGDVLTYDAATGVWKNVPPSGGGGAVASVNGQTGIVVLDAADVGAEPADATILKDADIGVTVQGYSAVLAGTTASFTVADETKLDGIAAGAEVNVNADWNAVAGDAQILNKPAVLALSGGITAVAIVAALPGTPDANTLYIVTG